MRKFRHQRKMKAMKERHFISLWMALALFILPYTGSSEPDRPIPDPDGKAADMTKPVKVFVLMGQSNMLGFGRVSGKGEGSLEHAVKEKGRYPHLVDDEGNWTTRKDVRNVRVMGVSGKAMQTFNNEWLTVKGNAIGPEVQFGHIMGEILDEPVLILKACIGNRALGWDLLPPGSVSYEYKGKTIPGYQGSPDPTQRPTEGWYAGKQYDIDTDLVKEVLSDIGKYYPGATDYEIAGFVWWQGHKYQKEEWAVRYEQNLVQLIKMLRQDFESPDALFAISTIAFGGTKMSGTTLKVAEAQLAVSDPIKYPEFEGNVKSFDARPFYRGGGAHYGSHAETYMDVGNGLGWAMAELIEQQRLNNPPAPEPEETGLLEERLEKDDVSSLFKDASRWNLILSARNISHHLNIYAQKPEETMNAKELFLLKYFSKDWNAVSKVMASIPERSARDLFVRILSTNAGRDKPVLSPADMASLLSLTPVALDDRSINWMVHMVKTWVLPEEEFLLSNAFERAVKKKNDPKVLSDLMIGRILMKTNFHDSALSFLPSRDEVMKMKNEKLKNEMINFLNRQKSLDEIRLEDIGRTIHEKYRVLLTKSNDKEAKKRSIEDLARYMYQLSPQTLKTLMSKMLENDPDLMATFLIRAMERMAHVATRDNSFANHSFNLHVLTDLSRLLDSSSNLSSRTWRTIKGLIVDIWLMEAERTLKMWSANLKNIKAGINPPFAKPSHLVASAPRGLWTREVSADLMKQFQLRLSKVTLLSARPEDAIDMIVELAETDPRATQVIAKEFIERWIQLNDPNIPDQIARANRLPADASIVVTPIMIRRNIKGLARIVSLLRENNSLMVDDTLLAKAFGSCYGKAEIYKIEDIETVFGPIKKIPDGLFSAIVTDMSTSLGDRWRKMATHNSALTARRQADVLALIREGYGYVIELIDRRLKSHPNDWKSMTAGGTLLSDWGDYEYFQNLEKAADGDRMFRYKEKNNRAITYFSRAANTYVEEVGKKANRVDNSVFIAWFNSLLGFNSNGDINLSKMMNPNVLREMRETIRKLPDDMAKRHTDSFAKYVEGRMSNKKKPLPPELRYKFQASSLIITEESPFAMEAKKKSDYYQELLKEVRLKTTVDGPNTIWSKEDFGILISAVHSEVMGDLINFAKYLQFKPAPQPRRHAPPTPTIRKMGTMKKARNEFEKNIYEAFHTFFEIKSITFSPNNVESFPIDKPGWSETVLAYVQVRPRGVSVDKIPPLELDLDYFDLDGRITIPVTSAETIIKVQERKVDPASIKDLSVKQTLDTRQLFVNGKLKLSVYAEGSGLIPSLGDIVDLSPLTLNVPVLEVKGDGVEGAMIDALAFGQEGAFIKSRREWVLHLETEKILEKDSLVDLVFPTPYDSNAQVKNQSYKDVELIDVLKGRVRLGTSSQIQSGATDTLVITSGSSNLLWAAVVIIVMVLLVVIVWLYRRMAALEQQGTQASDVFAMPETIDPFIACKWLRAFSRSDLVSLTNHQYLEIKEEISEIESSCFDPAKIQMDEHELRETINKWLKLTH